LLVYIHSFIIYFFIANKWKNTFAVTNDKKYKTILSANILL